MQTRYGEQAIFVNRPRKNRQYLVLNSPYNQSQPKSHRLLHLSKSKDKPEHNKTPSNQVFKS